MTHDKQSPSHEPGASKSQRRKEKVLHTRVSMVLEQELKALARNLRVPVSNLVRTILQDALATAGALGRVAEDELRGAAERLAHNRARLDAAAAVQGQALRESLLARDLDLPPEPVHQGPAATPLARKDDDPTQQHPAGSSRSVLEGVLGFQQMLLAAPTTCSSCGAALQVGETAYLGVRGTPGPQVIIGQECLPEKKEKE